MSDFDPIPEEWLLAPDVAHRLGISPYRVVQMAGAHTASRRKRNNAYEYEIGFIRRKLDPNP